MTWYWRFDSRSDAERFRRWAQAKKFNATLPHKLDAAIKPHRPDEPTVTPAVFTEDGWSLRKHHPAFDDD